MVPGMTRHQHVQEQAERYGLYGLPNTTIENELPEAKFCPGTEMLRNFTTIVFLSTIPELASRL
jgi:hypothetical protein